jgi:hypothetical protein
MLNRHSLLASLLILASLASPIHGSLGSTRLPWTSVTVSNQKHSPAGGFRLTEPPIFKDNVDEVTKQKINTALQPTRGGQVDTDGVVRAVGTITQTLISCGRTVLPPTVSFVKGVINFYRILPLDAIMIQIGLVYSFAGGYYPTLFSSLQAAEQCGWRVMLAAIDELTEEAIKVIDAIDVSSRSLPRKDLFLYQTNIVLKTVDPMKINQAAAALYTTWLGISAVLQREYARTITLSLTLAHYFEKITHWVLEPPVRLCMAEDYHKWIPVIIGWACKGLAMNIAWRIQRVLTAATSAMTGGLMVARASFRLLARKKVRLFGLIPESAETDATMLDEILGFMIAGLGFYTQIDAQYKNAFSFKVPFPLSLVTWPFDWAEKWIQWYITK